MSLNQGISKLNIHSVNKETAVVKQISLRPGKLLGRDLPKTSYTVVKRLLD